jgi:hypothetical protein
MLRRLVRPICAIGVALGLALVGYACFLTGDLGGEKAKDCSPRVCTLSNGTCGCSDTSTAGTHSCASAQVSGGYSGGDAGEDCGSGDYSKLCKAGLTCVIDLTRGRSAGVCESGYGRCPLSISSPY